MLGDQLPEVSQLLQQSGEEEAVVRVIGQQVEPECLNDAFLQPLHLRHIHQAWPIWRDGIRDTWRRIQIAFCANLHPFEHFFNCFFKNNNYLRSR